MKIVIAKFIILIQNTLISCMRLVLFPIAGCREPNRILVYRTSRLGDFIVAIPALVKLRHNFPSANIVLVTTASTSSLMRETTAGYTGDRKLLPWTTLCPPEIVNEVITIPELSLKAGFKSTRDAIKRFKPQAAFMLPFSGEDGISRLKKLIFFKLIGIRCPVYGVRVHTTFKYFRKAQFEAGMIRHQVLAPIQAIMEHPAVKPIQEKDVTFNIHVPAPAEQWAAQYLEKAAWDQSDIVAVFPGGSFLHKRWPVERFAYICRELLKKRPVKIIVIGAGDDHEPAQRLCEAIGPENCHNLVGKTSITKLAALLRHCRLYIGNDSGPAHLASALGCPCITIISSIEFPGLWEPWNSRETTLRHRVPCEYCANFTSCGNNTMACILGIQASTVLNKCLAVVLQQDQAFQRPMGPQVSLTLPVSTTTNYQDENLADTSF